MKSRQVHALNKLFHNTSSPEKQNLSSNSPKMRKSFKNGGMERCWKKLPSIQANFSQLDSGKSANRKKERGKEPESVFFSRCWVSQLREGENSNFRHFRRARVSERHTRRHLKEGDGREEEEQEKSRRRREKGLCTSSDDWRHRSVKKEKNKPFLKH